MKPGASSLSTTVVQWLYRRIILVLTVLFLAGAGMILWSLLRESRQMTQTLATQGAALQAALIREFRSLYTSNVVERLRPHGIEVVHDYASKSQAIPLPATFTIELGQHLSRSQAGLQVRLYSDYPFPWRADGGPKDAFERAALKALRRDPESPYVLFGEYGGQSTLRYAVADRMRGQCVACHNTHPSSPRRDWQVGDVRGVLEIISPLSPVIAQTRAEMRDMFLWSAGLGLMGLGGLGLVLGRLRQATIHLERQVEARTADLRDQKAALVGANASLEKEVGERRRVEEALRDAKEAAEEANRTKSRFLANMSHELRTPLNSIIGFSNILLKNKADNLRPEDLTFLQRVLVNGRHLLDLINQVLDLAKIEAKKTDIHIGPVSLEELVPGVLDQMESQARERDIRLVSEMPPVLAPLQADPLKLRQVLINLVGNALKFTERGRVTVRVMADSHTGMPLCLEVEDTGIGIQQDRLLDVFEAFRQGDSGTARKYGGTGLGLSISQALCQLMGFRIEVQSEVGVGSAFRVVFVAAPPPWPRRVSVGPHSGSARPEAGAETETATAGLSERLVLVIDDESDARLLMVHLIEECGCRVLAADSAERGLRMAREFKPDLITVDLLMPVQDGLELIRELKRDENLRQIPVLVASIVAGEHREVLPEEIELLDKPISRETLHPVIKRLLAARVTARTQEVS